MSKPTPFIVIIIITSIIIITIIIIIIIIIIMYADYWQVHGLMEDTLYFFLMFDW